MASAAARYKVRTPGLCRHYLFVVLPGSFLYAVALYLVEIGASISGEAIVPSNPGFRADQGVFAPCLRVTNCRPI
jgi:hypothetical protein